MKLASILFEDTISIIGYQRSNNPDLKKEDITMEPRITRQSKRGEKLVGFYITMPKMQINSIEDLPSEIEAPVDVGEGYGEYLYKISISVPRNQIKLENKFMGLTRITPKDLTNFELQNIKFIYIPSATPTAEGIILDPSIITSFEKIEQQGSKL